jgi:hypothetical protein
LAAILNELLGQLLLAVTHRIGQILGVIEISARPLAVMKGILGHDLGMRGQAVVQRQRRYNGLKI